MGFDRPGNDASVMENIVQGLKWSFDMFFNMTLDKHKSLFVQIESIQLTLDALFNLVMRLGQDNIDSYHLLLQASPLIDDLINKAKTEDRGPALYYKFKQRQFLGIYQDEQGDRTAALGRYKEAIKVWWEMHRLKSYGSGNGANDPYAEGCGILYDIAALSYVHHDFKTCLESIGHIISFYEEVWKARPQIPNPVQKRYATSLGIGGTCAMAEENGPLALKYFSEALSIFRVFPDETAYVSQTERLVSQLTHEMMNQPRTGLSGGQATVESDSQSRSQNRRVFRRKKK
jgi:tetratricopeptide (TPR) repeat protein